MASVSNYMFDGMTRGSNDNCAMSQQNVQDIKAADYMLTQFRPDCPMNNAMDLALNQPNVFVKGSHSVGINGCNVDDSSSLLFGDVKSRPACKISLFQRPFATVPYLGRGKCNPELESQIQQGDMVNNKKSVNPLMEKSFSQYSNYPLLPSLEATIQNPANLVEETADAKWVRGGISSRDSNKDVAKPAEKKNMFGF